MRGTNQQGEDQRGYGETSLFSIQSSNTDGLRQRFYPVYTVSYIVKCFIEATTGRALWSGFVQLAARWLFVAFSDGDLGHTYIGFHFSALIPPQVLMFVAVGNRFYMLARSTTKEPTKEFGDKWVSKNFSQRKFERNFRHGVVALPGCTLELGRQNITLRRLLRDRWTSPGEKVSTRRHRG